MTFAALFAAVTIAFPSEGARLPFLSRCYVMGAADVGEEVLGVRCLVPGATSQVSVCKTGAWATVVDVKPGTNIVEVGGTRRMFIVESPDTRHQTSGTRRYPKLEYASDSAKPHPTGKMPEEITVVIDAGHGGNDRGAVSPHGFPEKDANLRLAKATKDELSKRGYRVVMTREDDSFPALYDRPKVAHRENADAFISIHHNAPGYDKDPMTLRYHAVYAWNPLGERLARAINERMAATSSFRSEGVLHANFAVTRNPEIPSVLIEADFVTHPEGETAIWSEPDRKRTACAIADGFADWVAHGSRRRN